MTEKKDHEKRRKEIEKKIEAKLKKIKLKEKQCEGGKTAYHGEREAAMKLTHFLMEEDNMDFPIASKLAWGYVKEKRCEPCDTSEDEKTEGEEVE